MNKYAMRVCVCKHDLLKAGMVSALYISPMPESSA